MTDIGSLLGGRYRLVELLGEGGMATIYRARDAQLDRDVAVKLLRPELGRDPDFLARFKDEARAAASLSHPNIVAVFDFNGDGAAPYIVMELIEGQDLASILRDAGPLSPRRAARVAAEVAKALHAAHVRGIVHRDVKPSNILVGRDGRVKVADFGIARALSESQITMPGITMGSVNYFSPEQARGEPATIESDIYSLGIVLFESLTGKRPFTGDSAASIALARLTATPPRVSMLRPSVPPALDAIVRHAMELDPLDRFPSAAAMAEALEGYLAESADRPGVAPVVPPPGVRPPGAGPGMGAAGLGAAGLGAGMGAAGMGAGRVDASAGAGWVDAAGIDGARTVATGSARPNQPVPYAPDAYARAGDGRPAPMQGRPVPPMRRAQYDDQPEPTNTWAWVAGGLGIVILAVVAFLLFRMLTSGGGATGSPSPSAGQVTVPNLIGKSYTDAETAATALGLTVTRSSSEQRSDAPVDSVIGQDPIAGASVASGTQVNLTVAVGLTSVPVPDLRGKTEPDAAVVIDKAGLTRGVRTDAFDPDVPAGSIVSQSPATGILVAPGTPIDYVVSKGPEPFRDRLPDPGPHRHARPDADTDPEADARPEEEGRRLRLQYPGRREGRDRHRRVHRRRDPPRGVRRHDVRDDAGPAQRDPARRRVTDQPRCQRHQAANLPLTGAPRSPRRRPPDQPSASPQSDQIPGSGAVSGAAAGGTIDGCEPGDLPSSTGTNVLGTRVAPSSAAGIIGARRGLPTGTSGYCDIGAPTQQARTSLPRSVTRFRSRPHIPSPAAMPRRKWRQVAHVVVDRWQTQQRALSAWGVPQ